MSDESTDEPSATNGGIGRVSAILAAGIALLGALVGNLQLDASAEGAVVGRRAQQLENRAFGSQVRAAADLEHQINLDAVVSEYERRSVFAAIRSRVAPTPTAAQELEAEADVWAAAATGVAELSRVAQQQRADRQRVSRPTIQELDAIGRYELQRKAVPDAVGLERAAAAERAGGFGERGDAYVSIIALLAVALFLVGLSLTLPQANRRWIVGAALVLFAAGALWTLLTATSAVAETPPAAIEAVSRGTRLRTEGRLREAERAFTRAIDLRSDYAEAYARRFAVRSERAVEFRGGRLVGISVLEDRDLLLAAIEDGERAIDLGYADSDVPLSLGERYALLERYDDARESVRRAIEITPDEPLHWLNAAVYAAAQGDAAAARRATDRGIELAFGPRYVFAGPELLSAARSALDRIAVEHPARRGLVERLTARLAAASIKILTDARELPDAEADEVRIIEEKPAEIDVLEDFVVIGGTLARFVQVEAPTGTPLLFLWYARESPRDPWVEVVEAATTAEAYELPFTYSDGRKTGVLEFPFLDPGACPGRREYRLDVWAGDERVASIPAKDPLRGGMLHLGEQIGETVPIVDEVLGLELCRPRGWNVDRPADGVVSVTKPDGTVRVEAASIPVGDLDPFAKAQLNARTIDRLAADLSRRGPSSPVSADDGGTFANLVTYVGGRSDGNAGIYLLNTGNELRFVLFGAWTGPDGILRTVTIEAVAGDGVGVDYVNEFLTSIRFTPGPSVGAPEKEPEGE